jgi:gp16 family phage-associated protein
LNQLKTLEQVKKDFLFKGQSVSDWARKHGFKYQNVKEVLEGRSKCFRGEGHKIAVTLGIKDGEITES